MAWEKQERRRFALASIQMSGKLGVCIMLVGGVPDTLACPIIGFSHWQHGAHRRVLSVSFSHTHTFGHKYMCTPGWKRRGPHTASCRPGYTLRQRGTHTYTNTCASKMWTHAAVSNSHERQIFTAGRLFHVHIRTQPAIKWESSHTHVFENWLKNQNIYSQSLTVSRHYITCTQTPASSTKAAKRGYT